MPHDSIDGEDVNDTLRCFLVFKYQCCLLVLVSYVCSFSFSLFFLLCISFVSFPF